VGAIDSLSFYWDSLYSEADHVYERNDLNLASPQHQHQRAGERGAGRNHVVERATIANPVWLNENRPVRRRHGLHQSQPRMEWKIGEKFTLERSINYNHSDWFRSTNTYLFNSNLNTGITVDLEANGDGVIKVTPSRD
jgi:hypothetical protein